MTTKTCTCTSHGHCAACEGQREAHVTKTPSHTPAPWNYSDTAGSHQYAVFEEKNGRDIALVYNRGDHSRLDARLISAAPELLAACKAASDQEMECYSEGGNLEREYCLHCVLLDAIAKAEGNL